MQSQPVIQVLRRNSLSFHPVVLFDPEQDRLLAFDFTAKSTQWHTTVFDDTDLFAGLMEEKLNEGPFRYGIGGYNELRDLYVRSAIFDADKPGEEPRRLHLGVDIWGKAGEPVFAFMGGMVHSFAFNNHFGDYGATLIITHQLDGLPFYTLYGHICLHDIEKLTSGQYINRGQTIAHFGEIHENGHWPPHLHFQLILDLELNEGDYPGVCRFSEREKYLNNCPDPDVILMLNRYLE